jgi:AhpD family alkylhydroperoxidase
MRLEVVDPALARFAADLDSLASVALSPEVIAELAAVGSNCEPCLKFHYDKARKLGLTNADLVLAVRAAQMVKDTPSTNMLEFAGKLLAVEPADLRTSSNSAAEPAAPADTGCCSAPSEAAVPAEAGCCGPAVPVTLSSAPDTASKCC